MSIEKGNLIRKKDGKVTKTEYRIEILSTEHLNEVLKLNRLVYDLLPNKEILSLDSFEDMYDDLNKDGVVIGVLDNEDKILAYRYASFPGLEDRNLAYDLDFPIELEKVCQLETTIVHPDYRGNNLQSDLVAIMISMARERGYTDLVCTISPYNYFSINNIMKNGLKVRGLRKKYDNLLRFIMHGKVTPYDYGNKIDSVNTSIKDIEQQMNLLKNGFIGYELHKDETLDYVKFN